jgi:hypothetical protein
MRPATELKRAVVTMSTTAFAQLIMQRLRNGGLSLRWCLLRSAPSLRGCAFQIVSGDNQGVDVNRHGGFHLTMAISDTSQNEILKCRSAQRRLWGRLMERAGCGVVKGSCEGVAPLVVGMRVGALHQRCGPKARGLAAAVLNLAA